MSKVTKRDRRRWRDRRQARWPRQSTYNWRKPRHSEEPVTVTAWVAASAQARGLAHRETGQPCQDYALSFSGGEVNAICLADGAGSCRESHHGAKATVESLGEYLLANFDNMIKADQLNRTASLEELINEVLVKTARQRGCHIKDLSSTLLAVAVKSDDFIAIHIGDGVIGSVDDSTLRIVSLPWNGEYSNITTFTTSPNLSKNIRIVSGSAKKISGFILMSDGAAESLHYHGTERLAPAVAKLLLYCAEHPEDVDGQLQETLDLQLVEKTTDDCAVALLARKDDAIKLRECIENIPADWASQSGFLGSSEKAASSTRSNSEKPEENEPEVEALEEQPHSKIRTDSLESRPQSWLERIKRRRNAKAE